MPSVLRCILPLLYLNPVSAGFPQLHLSSNPDAGPSLENARANAPKVFNAVSASLRQWGSSLQHNGMSFFYAVVPENTTLYHGTNQAEPIVGTQWLAFEIEHAECFARGGRGGPPRGGTPGDPGEPDEPGRRPREGPPPSAETDQERHIARLKEFFSGSGPGGGYLQEYRTKKTLSLIYIDGMAAGKTQIGNLDSTDRILLNATTGSVRQDWQRAKDLCALDWDIDGFIRMETGFEIILCDFADGVEMLSATQRKQQANPGMRESELEYMRGVSQRYQGFPAGRVTLDYSHMVSAYFYTLNMTNPDVARASLPRLSVEDASTLASIKNDVRAIAVEGSLGGIDWQGVVDLIITRYADRLKYMAMETTSLQSVRSTLGVLLNAFSDARDSGDEQGIAHCTRHYLESIIPTTLADHLIQASISTVSLSICKTLFEVRALIGDEMEAKSDFQNESELSLAKAKIEELIDYLAWTRWKECAKCASYDEVCVVAMWPSGTIEDHEAPRCKRAEELGFGYWGGFGGPGHGPPPAMDGQDREEL